MDCSIRSAGTKDLWLTMVKCEIAYLIKEDQQSDVQPGHNKAMEPTPEMRRGSSPRRLGRLSPQPA